MPSIGGRRRKTGIVPIPLHTPRSTFRNKTEITMGSMSDFVTQAEPLRELVESELASL